MALRDRFMSALIKSRAKHGESGENTALEGELLPRPARMAMLFDGIKLIGTGNGAGVLGAVAAMYYFSARPELHFPMKVAAILFGIGLLSFALSVTAFLWGLFAALNFWDAYQ